MLEAMVVYMKIISEIFACEKTSTYLLSINRTLDISFPRIQPRLSRGVDRRCYLKEKRLLDDCTLRHQYAEHLQVIHIYESSDMCLLQPRPIRMPIAARYSGQGMTTGSSGITVMSATLQSPCRHPEMVGNRVRKPDPAWYEKREAHHLVLHDETTKKWQAIRESQIQPQAAAWKGTFLCRKL